MACHDRMVSLIERMLELHKRLASARASADHEMYQHQIETTDRQIDALVYELYGLTEEEIKLVEGKSPPTCHFCVWIEILDSQK